MSPPTPPSIDQAAMDQAVRRLRAGGLVAIPTETVYGLAADAMNPDAVRRVFEVKARPATSPLIAHIADEAMARAVTSDWPRRAHELARRFWPGPLTIIVKKTADLPEVVTAGGPGVGVRCPDHPTALALIKSFGGPLVAPSANPSGGLPPTTAEHVRNDFPANEVYVLDAGPCPGGLESTVLRLPGPWSEDERILRPGPITAEQVGHTEPGEWPAPTPSNEAPSPHTPIVLFEADRWPGLLDHQTGPGVILSHAEQRQPPAPHALIPMPDEAETYAARLYAALREAEQRSPAWIGVETPTGAGPLWSAIRHRLRRLAAGARL